VMKILMRKKAGSQPQTKIQKRVAGIGTNDLVMWAENALFVIGKELTHHQRDKNIEALYEMELAAEALLAITQELKKRADREW
jgi:hypothetical protein